MLGSAAVGQAPKFGSVQVRTRKDGSKAYTATVPVKHGEGTRVSVGTFDSEHAAHQAILRHGWQTQASAKSRAPLAFVADQHQKARQQAHHDKGKPSWATLRADENILAKYILPKFGKTPVADIGPAALNSWYLDLGAQGVTPGQRRKIHIVLNQLMKRAIGMELVKANPCTGVIDKPTGQREDDPDRDDYTQQAFTPAEAMALLEVSTTDWAFPFTVLGLFVGCRKSEGLGLFLQDLQLEGTKPVAHIRRKLEERRGQGLLTDTPTKGRDKRTVPLTQHAAGLLREYQKHELKRRGLRKFDPRDLVTTAQREGHEDKPVWDEVFYSAWKRTMEKAGLPDDRRFPPHSLRKTFVTSLLRASAPVHEVSALAGHKDPSITLKFYAKALPEDDSRQRAHAERAFKFVNAPSTQE
ncbi:MAG: site-specific integrase [Myxococcota bacterium]